MKTSRLLFTGLLMWLSIFTVFTALVMLPVTKNSLSLQNTLLVVFVAPIVLACTAIYYKTGANAHGIIVGFLFTAISLCLDALITLPLIIIPSGGSYQAFYSSTILWVVVVESITLVFLYWKFQVNTSFSKRGHPDF